MIMYFLREEIIKVTLMKKKKKRSTLNKVRMDSNNKKFKFHFKRLEIQGFKDFRKEKERVRKNKI